MVEHTDVKAIVQDIASTNGVVLRGFRSKKQLLESIQSALDRGQRCAFVPSLKTFREFLNTDGFIFVMNEIDSQLQSHQVIVPPNLYDSSHIYVVGPVEQAS